MTPADHGFVYAMLLTHREISTHPVGRSAHGDEARAARILADCGPAAMRAFDEYLGGQGFSLRILDGLIDLGLPIQGGRKVLHYVLGRRFGEALPPFIDRSGFLSAFRDRRRESTAEDSVIQNKATSLFWCARLWLTLQYFFYDRIDRPPGNLYMWRDAMVREEDFISQVKEELELMGNQGRPPGEAGVLWDTYWESRGSVPSLVRKFLKLMAQYRMLHVGEEDGVWRQSLVAAVDMATIAEGSLHYLIPNTDMDRTERTLAILKGHQSHTKPDAH